jgi:hypothetical protein
MVMAMVNVVGGDGEWREEERETGRGREEEGGGSTQQR